MISLEFKNIQELIETELYINPIILNDNNLKKNIVDNIVFYYEITNFDTFKEKYKLSIDIDISENRFKFIIDESNKYKLNIPFNVANFNTNETGIYNHVKIICEISSEYIYKKNININKTKKYFYNTKIIYI